MSDKKKKGNAYLKLKGVFICIHIEGFGKKMSQFLHSSRSLPGRLPSASSPSPSSSSNFKNLSTTFSTLFKPRVDKLLTPFHKDNKRKKKQPKKEEEPLKMFVLTIVDQDENLVDVREFTATLDDRFIDQSIVLYHPFIDSPTRFSNIRDIAETMLERIYPNEKERDLLIHIGETEAFDSGTNSSWPFYTFIPSSIVNNTNDSTASIDDDDNEDLKQSRWLYIFQFHYHQSPTQKKNKEPLYLYYLGRQRLSEIEKDSQGIVKPGETAISSDIKEPCFMYPHNCLLKKSKGESGTSSNRKRKSKKKTVLVTTTTTTTTTVTSTKSTILSGGDDSTCSLSNSTPTVTLDEHVFKIPPPPAKKRYYRFPFSFEPPKWSHKDFLTRFSLKEIVCARVDLLTGHSTEYLEKFPSREIADCISTHFLSWLCCRRTYLTSWYFHAEKNLLQARDDDEKDEQEKEEIIGRLSHFLGRMHNSQKELTDRDNRLGFSKPLSLFINEAGEHLLQRLSSFPFTCVRRDCKFCKSL